MMHRDPNLPAQPESAARLKGRFRTTLWIVVVIACALILFLRFGGDILVHTDPLPRHADVAVVLNGSTLGVRARTQGAVQLLKQGIVDYVMASVPPTTYWGESVPQVAHHYFAEHFGPQVADRVVFCVANTNSTIQEAGALRQCLESRGWRQVIVVTSNYHTRRAGRIWRAALAHANPPFKIYMEGIADGSFQARGWWRQREYVKTWLLETSKLIWESIFGLGPWKSVPSQGRVVQ